MSQYATESLTTPSFFLSKTLAELSQDLVRLDLSPVHARRIYRQVFKRYSFDLSTIGLPQNFFQSLPSSSESEAFGLVQMVHDQFESQYDGSIKFLVKSTQQDLIEMVLMPETKRLTLCISTQVGCAQGCTFCYTGRMGLKRSLSVQEIVGQVWIANNWLSQNPSWLEKNGLPTFLRVTNIVFMGMGEPLDNVENVAKAIIIFTEPYGFHIALRRISVSTAGHLDGLKKIVKHHPDVRLAISIHSPFNAERSKIMPINRRYPLDQVMNSLRDIETQKKNGILLQYTLINGVNDSLEHADELLRLIANLNVKINLIPLNPVEPSKFSCPDVERIEAFRDHIYKSGTRVLVRYSKGQDINAACGQLVIKKTTPELNPSL